ncbi:hypothetical protein D8M03_04455 [Lysinibacillus endophyticus]|uniref:Uncharacterized protein n=1 Tax=Ureibacillus endophyticus TaxID=1978490 RepID=A0A494Z8V4_9BACL|nr:hypothetical protein D8M03_04455 [Lysinibacillus endophyticus]
MKDVDFHFVWTLSAGMASTNFCRLWPAKMDFRLMLFPQESATLHSNQLFLNSKFSSLIFLNKFEKSIFVPNSFYYGINVYRLRDNQCLLLFL